MFDLLHREIARLRDELAERDETIRQLREALAGPPHRFPREWGLKPQGYAILNALYHAKHEWVQAKALFSAVRGLDDGEVQEPSTWLRPRLSQIRRKLPAIQIEGRRLVGYRLTPSDRAFLAPYV